MLKKICEWFNKKINKTKWFECYVAQETRFNIGQGKIVQFKNLFQLYILADLYIFVKFKVDVSPWNILLVSICLGIGFWFIGYIWDKLGILHIEQEFHNKRDPFTKQLREKFNIKEETYYGNGKKAENSSNGPRTI